MSRWWAISEAELHASLRRAADGEDPDLVMTELLANSRIEEVQGE